MNEKCYKHNGKIIQKGDFEFFNKITNKKDKVVIHSFEVLKCGTMEILLDNESFKTITGFVLRPIIRLEKEEYSYEEK